MTTWKWSVGWTWAFFASTGLGKAVGFTVGGPHGPGLIVSHHSRARLKSDHRQLWFRRFNSQIGYARKHLQCTPRPILAHIAHTLHPSYMTTREYKEFLFLRTIWAGCQSTGSCSYLSDGWCRGQHPCYVMLGEQSVIEKVSQTFCNDKKISHMYLMIFFLSFLQPISINF